MDAFAGLDSLGDAALLVGLSTTRITVAFLLMPVFSPDIVPSMVRNAVFTALGVLVLAFQPVVSPAGWNTLHWLGLLLKEAMLGLGLGFGMAAFLWAFTAAGQMVDTKVGATNAQLTDPLSGQQVTVSAALLGRLAGFLFMSSGGLLLFVGALLESFRAWPVARMDLSLRAVGVTLFEHAVNDHMSLAFLIAAPVLVTMFAVDLMLGLMNRYAPQLNVNSLAGPVKGLAATGVWMLALGTITEGFAQALEKHVAAMLPQLARLVM